MSEGVLLAIVGLAVVLAQGLVGIIKILSSKLIGDKKQLECAGGLTDEQNQIFIEHGQMLKNMYEMHNRYDSEGVPLIYVPRGWSETQKEIVKMLADIASTQSRTLDIIERLERKLEA